MATCPLGREDHSRPDLRLGHVCGGEGGIRTRDGLPRTAFPVRRHSPLGDLSLRTEYRQPQPATRSLVNREREDRRGQRTPGRSAGARRWRRGRDSNPRCFRTPLFESGTINHSDTSPRQRIPNVNVATARTGGRGGNTSFTNRGSGKWLAKADALDKGRAAPNSTHEFRAEDPHSCRPDRPDGLITTRVGI